MGSLPICWQKGSGLVAVFRKWAIRAGAALALMLMTVLAVRAWDAWHAPPLSLWHSVTPRELVAREIDGASWNEWIAAEDRVFAEVRAQVTARLPGSDQIPGNRYFAGSPMNAANFTWDWNRSYVLVPQGAPLGAVVLLHGLTDSPYSLRHVGEYYLARGFAVVAIRMPGHGTVPASLTRVKWQDWMAATRLGVRQARALAPAPSPLHVVGYSNGAALALAYALEATDNASLARPDQLVLFSPMVGITRYARFAGVLGWPAVFPGFAKAAWLDTAPEYNPFKYTSFPVNAARQSSQLVNEVRERFARLGVAGPPQGFPRVLAFQSVVDATVSTVAVVDLFHALPASGNELVLFDRNHAASVGPLIKSENLGVPAALASPAARRFGFTLVTGTEADPASMEARRTAASQTTHSVSPLAARYPSDMFSLSHVALPFPLDDPLYGHQPRQDEHYGVRLGTVAVRGERGALAVNMETLMRAQSNPFFGYVLERIAETLPRQEPAAGTSE
jgi:alpha-beta hydrolase superfamily lysophospholipase